MDNENVYVLGINSSNHDRSACLLRNGEIIVAISEERLDRRKHSDGFYYDNNKGIIIPPFKAINYCLNAEKIEISDLDLVVISRSMLGNLNEFKSFFPTTKVKIIEAPVPSHHLMHAYGAFFSTDYEESPILVIDEEGHWNKAGDKFEMITCFIGRNTDVEKMFSLEGDYYRPSIGMFYNFFASIIGFTDAMIPSAGKLMGLSSYCVTEVDYNIISFEKGNYHFDVYNLVSLLKEENILDKDFKLEFVPVQYSSILDELIKYTKPVDWRSDTAKRIASIAQFEIEKTILSIVREIYEKTESNNLCLSGGVFLNTIINSRIMLETPIKNLYIQPAATDDGTAIGASNYGYYKELNKKNRVPLNTAYLGKLYNSEEVLTSIEKFDIPYTRLSEEEYENKIVQLIEDGKIVCVFHGKSEFGPRALGHRSILVDPRIHDMKNKLNEKVKLRESFRPFAVAVIKEQLSSLFYDIDWNSPYMLHVGHVYNNQEIPAVTHVDNSVRIQTVTKQDSTFFYNLIKKFGDKTNVYALLNTSFNINNEPLVETPDDAIKNFILSDADVLAIDNYIITKQDIKTTTLEHVKDYYLNPINEDLLELGNKYLSNGQCSKAKSTLLKLISSNQFNNLTTSEKGMLFFNMATIYYSEKDYENAEIYLNKILNENFTEFDLGSIYHFASMIKAKLGKLDAAKSFYDSSNYFNSKRLTIGSLVEKTFNSSQSEHFVSEQERKHRTVPINKV